MAAEAAGPTVGLFVTCLVDTLRPSIGLASAKLLEDAGCRVVVPDAQTCCGQPGFNNGDDRSAARIARQVIAAFEGFDYLVAPSGSCIGMIRDGFAELLGDDPAWAPRQRALASRSFEILSFLDRVCGWRPHGLRHGGSATYHDCCSGLRQLGIRDEPRRLLAAVDGLALLPLEGADVCCGFGGTFCMHFADISAHIVADKTRAIRASGAEMLLAADLGCLLNMAGMLARDGAVIRCLHPVELLAGMADEVAP
ncbi:MAG: (Fe-S)-binding protein [Alphaproteobacteria bacterium]|nr:(Fe-S)-binding protein [Alphaproteobacteria bacterium]